jgi:hypothetical protein
MASVSPMKFRIASILLAATAAWAVTVPAGTELDVRLTTEVSSEKPSGQAVSAVVIAPVFVNGAAAISTGTRLDGTTADVSAFKAAVDQSTEQAATVRIQFTKIRDQAGHSKPLASVVESVDNARETVDNAGLIQGIAASQTFEAQMAKGISKLESRNAGLAQLLSGVKNAFVKPVDATITYKPGVELRLKLTKSLDWSAAAANTPGAIAPADALVALVNSQPFRTVAQSPPNPSDLTNLMFIGTAEQVGQAFREAGWFAADALGQSSKMETARAIIENRGYNEAPMSVLYLDSKPPDFALQKQNNTFAKRHHIRIWQRPDTFQGKPVWVAAATHDISITVSPVSHQFTHGIDSNIDLERSKVLNDLVFSGHVRGVALMARTQIPKDISNATGDKLITDGKMAVLEF